MRVDLLNRPRPASSRGNPPRCQGVRGPRVTVGTMSTGIRRSGDPETQTERLMGSVERGGTPPREDETPSQTGLGTPSESDETEPHPPPTTRPHRPPGLPRRIMSVLSLVRSEGPSTRGPSSVGSPLLWYLLDSFGDPTPVSPPPETLLSRPRPAGLFLGLRFTVVDSSYLRVDVRRRHPSVTSDVGPYPAPHQLCLHREG